jgi:hypothetical protein
MEFFVFVINSNQLPDYEYQGVDLNSLEFLVQT